MSCLRVGTAVLVIAVSGLPLVVQPAGSQQTRPQTPSMLRVKVSYDGTSTPQSGVKLLEDIFLRVRNAPQVAMAKTSPLMKSSDLQAPQAQGPTDYKLAIRPRDTTRNSMLAAPSLAWIPGGQDRKGGLPAEEGGYRAEPVAAQSRGLAAQSASRRDESMDSSKLKYALPAADREVALGKDQVVAQGALSRRRQSPSGQAATAPPSLAQATQKLFDLGTKLDQAERLADDLARANVSAADENQPNVIGAAGGRARLPDSFLSGAVPAAPQVQQIVPSPVPASSSARLDTIIKEAAPGGAWKAGSQQGIWEAEPVQELRKKVIASAERDLIALLPPNVVTGIPLVKLGVSEAQASSVLAQMGSMQQTQVNRWKVWSWRKPESRQQSLQLYVRNGLLDAMRIFDASLVGADFGVNLGDDVSAVKRKFGEPAFILSEPQPGTGQNYIYPISQVGFHLARPAPDQPPRVVSVLIFNVK